MDALYAVAGFGALALLWARRMSDLDVKVSNALHGDVVEADYEAPITAYKVLPIFHSAATLSGVPEKLLLRVGQQESNFNPDAYNEGSGASGIMQLIPRFYPDVNPWDPREAVPAAARSLKRYYDHFGSWTLALAAYNWGPGNLSAALGDGRPIHDWPQETRRYIADITTDTGIA
jgi:soluble lytic murein transglycosylase-like protein